MIDWFTSTEKKTDFHSWAKYCRCLFCLRSRLHSWPQAANKNASKYGDGYYREAERWPARASGASEGETEPRRMQVTSGTILRSRYVGWNLSDSVSSSAAAVVAGVPEEPPGSAGRLAALGRVPELHFEHRVRCCWDRSLAQSYSHDTFQKGDSLAYGQNRTKESSPVVRMSQAKAFWQLMLPIIIPAAKSDRQEENEENVEAQDGFWIKGTVRHHLDPHLGQIKKNRLQGRRQSRGGEKSSTTTPSRPDLDAKRIFRPIRF